MGSRVNGKKKKNNSDDAVGRFRCKEIRELYYCYFAFHFPPMGDWELSRGGVSSYSRRPRTAVCVQLLLARAMHSSTVLSRY